MLKMLRSILGQTPDLSDAPRVPDGERYYVIGDIHGRADLFKALTEAIEQDDAARGPADTHIILLGDLVDRGPDSSAVIEHAMALSERRNVRCLAGNHEEMFLDSFNDIEVLRHFVKHGGRETILSYGFDKKRYNSLSMEELQSVMDWVVPKAHREFLESFEEMILAGDYAFVHAGIDPKRAIDEQKRKDLLWIRDRFLSHDGHLSHVIVHGHTIFDAVVDQGNRISIDTGAYRTGRLTALMLEGSARRTLHTVEEDGRITIEKVDYAT